MPAYYQRDPALEIWPQPRPGDRFLCTFTPQQRNIVMRVLRKLRLVKPAKLVQIHLVATADGVLATPLTPEQAAQMQSFAKYPE